MDPLTRPNRIPLSLREETERRKKSLPVAGIDATVIMAVGCVHTSGLTSVNFCRVLGVGALSRASKCFHSGIRRSSIISPFITRDSMSRFLLCCPFETRESEWKSRALWHSLDSNRSKNLKKTCALDLKYLKSCKRKEGEEEEELSEESDRRKSLVSPLEKARISFWIGLRFVLKVYRTGWLLIDCVVHPCTVDFQGRKEKAE